MAKQPALVQSSNTQGFVFRDMIGCGYRGLQEPHDAFWRALRDH